MGETTEDCLAGGRKGREAEVALSLAAPGHGQCQLPPQVPGTFLGSGLYKLWLWLRKHQLWQEEQGLKDLFPSPTPAHRPVRSAALSHSCMRAAIQRFPALKITPDPWLASQTPHDFIPATSLTNSSPLSPLFLHSMHIPTSGSSPCCSLCLEHTFPRQPQAGLPHFIQVSAQVSGLS